MKKVLIPVAVIAGSMLLGAITLKAPTAHADDEYIRGNNESMGGRMKGLESKAELFGITLDEMLEAKTQGKTMLEIAEENGISKEEFQQMMTTRAVERWQERGLSEDEINSRLQTLSERRENCDGTPNMGSPFSNGKGNGMNRDGNSR